MKTRAKYVYILPRDMRRLVIDVVVTAGVDAMRDGMNAMSREVITEKAKDLCNQLSFITKTNDIEEFKKTVIENYVTMYLEKQKVYRADITRHQMEVEAAKDYVDFVRGYRLLVEQSLEGGR